MVLFFNFFKQKLYDQYFLKKDFTINIIILYLNWRKIIIYTYSYKNKVVDFFPSVLIFFKGKVKWMDGLVNGKCGMWAAVACARWIISTEWAWHVRVYACADRICWFSFHCVVHLINHLAPSSLAKLSMLPALANKRISEEKRGKCGWKSGGERPVTREGRGESAQRTIKGTNQLRGLNCGQLIRQFARQWIGLVQDLVDKQHKYTVENKR